MKIDAKLTDAAVLKLMGQRLTQLRLARNLTQQQLAEQAGLGLRTVQRLELGAAATQLSGFVRVCRVLGLVERLDQLVPETTPSPLEQLKLQGRRRQRASAARNSKGKTSTQPAKWTWGDAS